MIFFLLFQVAGGQESSGRRITSKYFNSNKQKGKDEKEKQELPAKRKNAKDSEEIHEDDGDDSVLPCACLEAHYFLMKARLMGGLMTLLGATGAS